MPSLSTTARWVIGERDHEAESLLQRELGIPSIVAAILAQRGFTDPAVADKFLNPRLEDLHDPRRLPDYSAAQSAILGAKERGELIFVHGDYDVDGVTSASLLHRFLKAVGCNVHTHVPHRMKEGYGIHRSAVEQAKTLGAKLFLTCDCGIAALEQVRMAREAGMTVVVTDHHTVGSELPAAHAVVNPHRHDSEYPFEELSGAGVAFKLCQGLAGDLGQKIENYHRAFLDLAALGTIADVMPLLDENRIIARFGLARLAETKKIGIRALMNEAKINLEPGKPLRSYHVGFVLGPRLNAAGRLDDAGLALQLLIETEEARAAELARTIEGVNASRKSEQQRIIDEATEMVLTNGWHERNVIVVANEGWHSGIVGIVAGRLVEQFHRPTFVMSMNRETGRCKGSARTIPGFHLADAIRAFPDLMEGGGHAAAAGCSFSIDDYERVGDALHEYAGRMLTPDDFVPTVNIDLEVEFGEVTLQTVEAMERLEPFGCANPEPTFIARGVSLAQILPTKNPAHVRLMLRRGTSSAVPGIAFGIGERLTQTGPGATADLLFQPNVEEWRGMRSLKWQVKDYVCA